MECKDCKIDIEKIKEYINKNKQIKVKCNKCSKEKSPIFPISRYSRIITHKNCGGRFTVINI